MVFLVVRLELKMQAVDSIMINELISSYSGSKGPFLKFLGWNNHPCARFDKAPETARGLWSHKQVTSFPSEKSVQDLNWVTNCLLPHPQGINDVTAKLIGFIKELHHMGLKTSFDVHNKQYNSERPCFKKRLVKVRNMWISDNWINIARGRSFVWIISSCSVNENKRANQLQTGLMRNIILKLHENETCSLCVCMVTGRSSVRLQAFSLLLKSLWASVIIEYARAKQWAVGCEGASTSTGFIQHFWSPTLWWRTNGWS